MDLALVRGRQVCYSLAVQISQDEAERLFRVIDHYEQLVRILLDRPQPPNLDTVNDIMRQVVQERLVFYHANAVEAAKSLGISRNTLYNWLKRCRLTRTGERSTGVVDSAA